MVVSADAGHPFPGRPRWLSCGVVVFRRGSGGGWWREPACGVVGAGEEFGLGDPGG